MAPIPTLDPFTTAVKDSTKGEINKAAQYLLTKPGDISVVKHGFLVVATDGSPAICAGFENNFPNFDLENKENIAKFLEDIHGMIIKANRQGYANAFNGVFLEDGAPSVVANKLETENWLGKGGIREYLKSGVNSQAVM